MKDRKEGLFYVSLPKLDKTRAGRSRDGRCRTQDRQAQYHLAMEEARLPLFPLGTVLFPEGVLALQVFEVRYLDLVRRCEREERPFGIVLLEQGQEVRRAPQSGLAQATTERLAPVGTRAHLERVEQVQPGLLQIRVRGGQRFRIVQPQLQPHGLWTAQVDWLPTEPNVTLPGELDNLRSRLARMAPAFADDDTLALPPVTDICWQDTGWLANRWAERLPLPSPERQRLMTLDNPVWRLELVAEWLDRLERLGQSTDPRP
jgi:Lon protease-like protein